MAVKFQLPSLLGALLLASCAIAPYRMEEFRPIDDDPNDWDPPYVDPSIAPYVVGGDFLWLSIDSSRTDTHEAYPPYRVRMNLHSGGDTLDSVYVHNFSVSLNGAEVRDVSLTYMPGGKLLKVPGAVDYKTDPTMDRFHALSSWMDIEHNAGAVIVVTIDIELVGSEASDRRQISRSFKAVVNRGFIRVIPV